MNRRAAVLLGALALIAVSLLVRHVARREARNAESAARLIKTTTVPRGDPRAQLRLRRETRRLERLRESLAAVLGGGGANPDLHLQPLHKEIVALEAELALPSPESQAATPVNEEYQRRRLEARAAHQAELLTKRREIDERLGQANADAVKGLTALRAELDEELSEVGGERSAEDELAQMRAERADLERRVADLRTDFTYWSEQKSGAGAAGRQTRAAILGREIQEQEALVHGIERALRGEL